MSTNISKNRVSLNDCYQGYQHALGVVSVELQQSSYGYGAVTVWIYRYLHFALNASYSRTFVLSRRVTRRLTR